MLYGSIEAVFILVACVARLAFNKTPARKVVGLDVVRAAQRAGFEF